MAVTKREVGQSVLATFIGTLPAELQTAAQDLFAKPEAAPALDVLGESAMMRQDYSRAQDTVAQETARLEAWKGQLEAWQTTVKDLAVLGEQAKAAGWTPGTPDPSPHDGATLPADLVRKADVERLFEEKLARERQDFLSYDASMNDLSERHRAIFGAPLNRADLMADPRVKTLGILGVYDAKYKAQIDEKTAAAETARINALVETRLAEERKKLGNPRFPSSRGADDSPLTVLEAKQQGQSGPDSQDLADFYEDLVARKAVGAAP